MIPDLQDRGAYTRYVAELTEWLWQYRERRFANEDGLFDSHRRPGPPVFVRSCAHWDVLTGADASAAEREQFWAQLPWRTGHLRAARKTSDAG